MEMKRGRLKSVTINHKYDQGRNLSGHTVEPNFAPAEDNDNDAPMMPGRQDIETVHPDHDSAIEVAKGYHDDNVKRFGGKGKKKSEMPSAMREAMKKR